MSVKIKINWDNENAVSDSVRIYRADSTFTSANLPPLLTEIFGNVYEYEDFDVVEGQTYYYMLSAKRGEQEAFTECFEVVANTDQLLPNEMYFTTTTGSLNYAGSSGDIITLSDGTTYTLSESSVYSNENVPAGKHKVKLVTERSSTHVGIDGEALIELHNFPALSTVTQFDFCSNSTSPNLVKVPTVLPSNITGTWGMFYDATSFNQDISSWDVSNVTDMSGMFENATSFNQPLNSWNVSNVNNMGVMFYNATSFNQPLNNWDVSNVTDVDDMYSMFYGAASFNQDLSQWCVPNIVTKPGRFNDNAPLFTEDKHPVWGTCPRGENLN